MELSFLLLRKFIWLIVTCLLGQKGTSSILQNSPLNTWNKPLAAIIAALSYVAEWRIIHPNLSLHIHKCISQSLLALTPPATATTDTVSLAAIGVFSSDIQYCRLQTGTQIACFFDEIGVLLRLSPKSKGRSFQSRETYLYCHRGGKLKHSDGLFG